MVKKQFSKPIIYAMETFKGMDLHHNFRGIVKWCKEVEAYSEPCQISTIEIFAKIVNDF